MSWNREDSASRIQEHLDNMGEIEVRKLTREADLEGLLSETVCRDIYGAHVYVQVSNFAHMASDNTTEDDYKRMIQCLHIYQRSVTHIVKDLGGTFVHFQGAKLHALFYRPIDNAQKLATRAVFLQLVLQDFVENVFNSAFSYEDFTIAGGADLGNAIGTMNGINGDREMLFLGSPANHAAKIISSARRLRLTKNVYESLPDDLRALCLELDGSYQLKRISKNELDILLSRHGLTWKRDTYSSAIEKDKLAFPLNAIAYSSAEVPFDIDTLSVFNNKRVFAASIFADLSGFTRYIDAANTNEEKEQALRVLHAFRKEAARVIKKDFSGTRVQYQGDRVQGIFYLPKDKEALIAKKVVETAAGLQSSMVYTLREVIPEIEDLKLAIGIDMGMILVSNLGARGQRDRICLGESVERAAQLEEKCEGGQIGVSRCIHDLLPEPLQGRFLYNEKVQGYVAENLTTMDIERIDKAEQVYGEGAPVNLHWNEVGVTVSNQEAPHARTIVPAPRYTDEA